MKIIDLDQNTPEWLEFRKNKIGASDAPKIMQDSPWESPYDLWELKMGFKEPEKDNYAMAEGKRLEPIARATFEDIMGKMYSPYVVQHDEHPWMIASLDGFNNGPEKNAVEIKCVGESDHETALNGKVPRKYFYQLQHQMEVAGLDKIYYFSFDKKAYNLDKTCQGTIIEVKRDQKMIDEMLVQELKFLECMKTCTPPELGEDDYEIREDTIWQLITKDWHQSKIDLDYSIKKEKVFRDALIKESNSRNCKGYGVKVQKIIRKGSVDYSKITELQGIDLEQYRKPEIESWRITADD